jgi:cell division protein FtsW
MKQPTTVVWTVVLALVLMGVLMVYSASALNRDSQDLLKREIISAVFGIVALFVAARFDYHRLGDRGVLLGLTLLSVGLLAAVLVPGIGVKVDGARRWIRILGFSFQPSELGKFTMVVLLTVWMTHFRETMGSFFAGFVIPGMMAGFFALAVLAERDLGVPFMMVGTAAMMMYIAGTRRIYLYLSGAPVIGVGVALVVLFPHRLSRLLAFVNPWDYRNKSGWQLIQSLSAFARGSVLGSGMGAGEQKLGYLPAAHTDFIFPVVGEELGLVGTLTLVVLFAALGYAAYRIAVSAQDRFGMLLAAGIGVLITFQAAFIMLVTTGMLPTKGLPLPFISYGGTALIVYMGMMGVMINIGMQSMQRDTRRGRTPSQRG